MTPSGLPPAAVTAPERPSTTQRVISIGITTLSCAALGWGMVEGLEMLVPPGYAGCFPIPPVFPTDVKVGMATAGGISGAIGWGIDATLERVRSGQRAALEP